MAVDIDRVSQIAEAAINSSPNLLVVWYLLASYAYYKRDKPIISDGLYDTICFLLMEELDAINIDHPHAYLCDPVALQAGTAYHIKDYPSIVVSTAERFIDGRFPV